MDELVTSNLLLKPPCMEDFLSLNEFENRNKEHLLKWESTSNSSMDQECQKRLELWIKECEEGRSVRFFIKAKENPDRIIGLCNFTQIFYGSFQACYLGYKIDHEYEGKGFMMEALQASIAYIFEKLNLHRIMANYMPSNTRSAKLLKRLRFEIEGYAKNYLLINSKWEDHVLTSLTSQQWKSNSLH